MNKVIISFASIGILLSISGCSYKNSCDFNFSSTSQALNIFNSNQTSDNELSGASYNSFSETFTIVLKNGTKICSPLSKSESQNTSYNCDNKLKKYKMYSIVVDSTPKLDSKNYLYGSLLDGSTNTKYEIIYNKDNSTGQIFGGKNCYEVHR